MAAGFIRRYQLAVKSPIIDGDVLRGTLEDHQINAVFSYNSTSTKSSGDTHQIKIFNPDRDTLVALREKGAMVEVYAGYQFEDGIETLPDELPLIFRGEVTESTVVRTSTDTVLTLELTQGYSQFQSAKVSESFKAGERLEDVLEVIISRTQPVLRGVALEGTALLDEQLGGVDSAGSGETFQVGKGAVIALGDRQDDTLLFDRSYSGPVIDVLEEFSRSFGLRWYIFLDTIYVVTSDEPSACRPGEPVITEVESRVKGDINWTIENTTDPSKPQSVQVDLTLFLFPTIAPGNVISLTLEDSEVTLTIVSIIHSLDYYGDTWETHITAISQG